MKNSEQIQENKSLMILSWFQWNQECHPEVIWVHRQVCTLKPSAGPYITSFPFIFKWEQDISSDKYCCKSGVKPQDQEIFLG